MSACPDSEILGAFAEGRLHGAERDSVHAERERLVEHLSGCPRCRGEVAMLAEFAGQSVPRETRLPQRWWLAAAAAVVILGSSLLVWEHTRGGGDVAPLVSAAEELGYRPNEARLSGGFDWAEFRGAVRATQESRNPKRLKLSGAAGELLQRAERDPDPDAQHAAGIAALLIEDPNDGIARLRKVTETRPGDARAWNDLAAAYHEAAVRFGRASELPLALAAIDAAVRLAPRMPEALFNRALITERLGLLDEARAAWRAYLAVDPDSEWALEARTRLGALPESKAHAPQSSRSSLEVETLGRWGEAHLAGAHAEAEKQLALARGFRASGEELLADAVAAIDAATDGDRRRLATAHVAYRTARLALANRDAETARRELQRAAALFRDTPFALLSRYYLASADYVANRIDESERELFALRADPRVKPSYKALRAQLAWQFGLTQARLARWPVAIEEYRAAHALFRELGEEAPAAFLDSLVAEAAILLGRRDEAWERWCRSMRTLSTHDWDDRLAVTLGTAGRSEWIAGRGTAARSLLDVEIRRGAVSGAVRADALLRRTILAARMSDTAAASAALADAQRAVASIEDRGAREAMAADLRVAEGIAFAASDRTRALDALTGAIAHFGESRRALLPVALFERGRVLQAMQRGEEAASDLRAAAAALEAQGEHIEWRDIRSGSFGGAEQIYTTLAELLLERGSEEEAFDVVDRAAAHAFFGTARDGARPRLADGAAVVEYLLLPGELVAFVLDARGLRVRRIEAAPATLAARAAALDAAIRDRADAETIRAASSALHALLVEPIRGDLAGAASVTFVPPPTLAATPFAALFDAQSNRWLIEDHAVRVAPSARHAAMPAGTRRAAKVVIIRPSTDGVALPSAADEAATLMRIYPHARLLEDATPSAVLASFAGADVIHYAGHVDSERETGLVLRSAGGRDELLYGADVARTRLAGSPLVILAGCRSTSLVRAFLLAGARAVVGTSWDVDDDAAAALFARMHEALAASGDPAAALRDAQLALLHQPARHVADWAAAHIVVRTGGTP